MKRLAISILVLTILLMPVQAFAAKAEAVIAGTGENSKIAGSALFQDTEEGLKADIKVAGAAPGLHGIHIHENGSCEDKGNAAGGHYNPDGMKHGFLPTDGMQGAHAGDLGNITINEMGEGNLSLTIPGLTVNGEKHPIVNRAVILHEKQDDFGQPTGNAGGRVACGVIKASE